MVDVVPESSAALAGVAAGDILVRLDDTDITEMLDLIFEIKQKKAGDEAILVIERDGETLRLPVVFKEVEE